MDRMYTVEVIVTEEDTSFSYAESDDEVSFDHLQGKASVLLGRVIQRVSDGRADLDG